MGKGDAAASAFRSKECAGFGPEAVAILAALPRRDGAARVFPEDLTSARLYAFWVGVRDEAGPRGVRIHDARHTYASQAAMNGVGLTAAGKLLGHRKRATTAIYAHLDDAALRDAAAQAAAIIARAMGYRVEPLPAFQAELPRPDALAAPQDERTSRQRANSDEGLGETGRFLHPSRGRSPYRQANTGGEAGHCRSAPEIEAVAAVLSAALKPGTAHGWRVDGGFQLGLGRSSRCSADGRMSST